VQSLVFVVVPVTNWVAVAVTVEEDTTVVVEAGMVVVTSISVLCWLSVIVEVLAGSWVVIVEVVSGVEVVIMVVTEVLLTKVEDIGGVMVLVTTTFVAEGVTTTQ
jgi:hypothetical protein